MMRWRRSIPCLAVIASLVLGVSGCGGGAPKSGESIQAAPANAERQKTMLDGYMKRTKTAPKVQKKQP